MKNSQDMTVPDEHELLRQASALDERALGTVFDQYYPVLYRYIYHHVRHVQSAEDLAADVFQRFLESIQKGKGPNRHLKAWLYRVAHNLVIDDSRRAVHRNHSQLDEEQLADEDEVSEQVQHLIQRQQAYSALDQLTEKQRQVITLKFIEGLTNREVARVLGMTVGTVKSLQHRGLASMQRHLFLADATTGDQDEI
jgi:RNA polymerase sigma-70 factor (ECF subfamily)